MFRSSALRRTPCQAPYVGELGTEVDRDVVDGPARCSGRASSRRTARPASGDRGSSRAGGCTTGSSGCSRTVDALLREDRLRPRSGRRSPGRPRSGGSRSRKEPSIPLGWNSTLRPSPGLRRSACPRRRRPDPAGRSSRSDRRSGSVSSRCLICLIRVWPRNSNSSVVMSTALEDLEELPARRARRRSASRSPAGARGSCRSSPGSCGCRRSCRRSRAGSPGTSPRSLGDLADLVVLVVAADVEDLVVDRRRAARSRTQLDRLADVEDVDERPPRRAVAVHPDHLLGPGVAGQVVDDEVEAHAAATRRMRSRCAGTSARSRRRRAAATSRSTSTLHWAYAVSGWTVGRLGADGVAAPRRTRCTTTCR